MINKNGLKAAWVGKGLTQTQIAKVLGITPKTFSLKLKKGILGSNEIEVLINVLEIKNPVEIFFANNVT